MKTDSSSTVGRATGDQFPEPLPIPAWKRVLDLLIVALASPVAGPIFLFAAAWVWLISKGNILFVQERIGRGGRPFRCYKLRTMHVGSNTTSHEEHLQRLLREGKPMLKLDSADPRLLPGSRILRALGVDELPQLFNVVRGEMSIIGPRPCIPYEAEKYEPWQRERFAGLPGLTGLWQVKGKNRTTFVEMVRLDIAYLRTQNLWLDIHILVATPKALLIQLANALWNRAIPAGRRSSQSTPVPIPTTDGSGVVG